MAYEVIYLGLVALDIVGEGALQSINAGSASSTDAFAGVKARVVSTVRTNYCLAARDSFLPME